MDKRKSPVYDERRRSKASITAVLRSIVAFYLAYLGFTIAQNSGTEATTMEPLVGYAVCAVFTAVAIGFGVYTLKRYQIDLKAAEISSEASAQTPEISSDGSPSRSEERSNHED